MDQLLDDLERHGKPADLVEIVAVQLPIIIICDLLGVSPADQDRFRRVSSVVLATGGPTRQEIIAASQELAGYLAELIAQRREQPGDDLLSALVQARDEEDKLSEPELVQLGVNLLFAGYETTANQVANFAYVLLTDRPQWNRLLADRTLVPNAVEELLRWIPLAASGGFARIATEDVELSGVLVKKGEAVFAKTHAANRDDSVFGCPEQLDLTREEIPHMTFGHGMHRCLGAQLARLELQVALDALLTRYPNLALAMPAEEVEWKTGVLLRGPETLPVTW
jgi:nocardicin N-oxygenase